MSSRRRHSLLYLIYLRSPLWRIRRRVWIITAGGRCERCGRRHRLTIHHRTYRRLGHERRADVTVLCWPCHRQQHAHLTAPPNDPWAPRRYLANLSRRATPHRHRPLIPRLVLTVALITLLAAVALGRGRDTDEPCERRHDGDRPCVGSRLVSLRPDYAPPAARIASRSLRSLPLTLTGPVPLGRRQRFRDLFNHPIPTRRNE